MTARNVPDPTGELHRAQQRIDTLQRFALLRLVAVIVQIIILIVLICF